MYDELEIAITPHGCGSDLHKTVMQAYTSFHELSKLQTGRRRLLIGASLAMLVVALLAEWVVYGVGRARSTGSNNVGGQPVKSLDFTLGTAVGTVCVNIVTISFAYAWVDALAAWTKVWGKRWCCAVICATVQAIAAFGAAVGLTFATLHPTTYAIDWLIATKFAMALCKSLSKTMEGYNFAVWTGIFPPPKAPYPEDIMQDVRDSIAMDQAEERRMREAEVGRVPIGTPRPTKTKRQLNMSTPPTDTSNVELSTSAAKSEISWQIFALWQALRNMIS
ncbi:hypothetical protein WJX75_007128 [Coccomyxa subellipsoidea]|uniref:Transmembrane protein n=1 Tax=Coccomyxa subellipsoidea TaxID=248742 RepID=A0ABR2YT31_9CHLO